MANHKSAAKRSRQSIKKTKVNRILSSRIKNSCNKALNSLLSENKALDSKESLQLYNSMLSKGVKGGVIKKRNASRKLSSFSNRLKKIT